MANEAAKPKSAAQAKAAYDDLARQCTAMAAGRPRVRLEIERRVKAELGDFDNKFAALKSAKAAAALELFAAEERERPAREARAAAEAAARAAKEKADLARANAKRLAEADALQTRSLKEATL